MQNVQDYDCIGIDEGQFFPDLVQWVEEMANAGKHIIVAALDGTFQRKPFGDVLDLIPMAEAVTKLTAVCMQCHQPASFSKRLGDETEVEVIGGAEKYISVCRSCYFRAENASASHDPRKTDCHTDVAARTLGLSVSRATYA